MDFRFEPHNLQIIDINTMVCPCCTNILQREIRTGKILIGEECGYCSYSNRAFASCSTSWQQHFPNGCTCTYGETEYLHISCENCKSPTCVTCKNLLTCCNKICGSVICEKCVEKTNFNKAWKTTTPQEKLHLYGTEKLKILAKNKKIKGFSKYKKNDLINILSPLVHADDFPIK
jgi:hypothetical protein